MQPFPPIHTMYMYCIYYIHCIYNVHVMLYCTCVLYVCHLPRLCQIHIIKRSQPPTPSHTHIHTHTHTHTYTHTHTHTQAGSRRIEVLVQMLGDISHAGEEEASDPFTSTFEALRVMKTTISKLDTVVPPESTHSDSSSEYTTPAQSQTTSPTREVSPPSHTASSDAMLKGLQALGLSQDTV